MVSPIVKRYLIALDRHKWIGVASFVVIAGISGGIAALQPPPSETYLAQGLLSYSAPPETFSATGAALQQQAQSVTKESLLSNEVLELALQQLAAQGIEMTPKELRQAAKVNTNLPTAPAEGETATPAPTVLRISVAYTTADEEKSKAIVTALMTAMMEQSRALNTQQLDRILENLNQLSPKVLQEVQSAERNLENFIRRESTVLNAAQSGDLVKAISGNQQQQRELRLSLTGIESQLNSLQAQLGLTPEQAYAASALSADPIIADLRAKIYQAESQRDLLAKTLRPDHPSMVDLQNQLNTFDQLLQARVSEVIGGGQAAPLRAAEAIRQASSLDPARQTLATNLVSLKTQRDALQEQLNNLARVEQELRQQYGSIPNQQVEQQRLEQQVLLKRTFYDQIQARLADVRLAQEETVGSLVVVAEPIVEPQLVEGLNSLVILIAGSVIGIVVGAGVIFLLGSLDATLHTQEEIQSVLQQQEVPMLGLLPMLPEAVDSDRLPLVIDLHSPYLDPYERLRGNLRRAGGGKTLKVILLASTVSEEGKTTTAYNFAIASARAGKRTLLVEANLRSPSQVASLGLIADGDSLVEPLRYYGNLSECIRLSPIENLYIVASVGPQRHAAAILESSEMRRLLEDGRGRFDLVIIDTPCLSRYNDALLLEPSTDGILLVTRPGYTEGGLLNEVTQDFVESEEIQLIGAVINDANLPIQAPERPDEDIEAEVEEPGTEMAAETPALSHPEKTEEIAEEVAESGDREKLEVAS